MSSTVQKLAEKQLLHWPAEVPIGGIQYEAVTGSVAYGVVGESSDVDLVGFCIPRKEDLFPHLKGEIPGFGRQKQRFEQYLQHHIFDPETTKQYDIVIYNIVKFFTLCTDNNPNIVDTLFVPAECVLYSTRAAQKVRENRRLFLHKGCWHKFKGYAYSQLHKLGLKVRLKPPISPPRGRYAAPPDEFDFKFAYHTVRLLLEVEQILTEGDLDLRRPREQLKAIRRGEWTLDQIRQFFTSKEKELESLYLNSKAIPYGPPEDQIRQLLLDTLEDHYGSLQGAVASESRLAEAMRTIAQIASSALP